MRKSRIAILALAFGLLFGPILVSCSKETSESTANVIPIEFQCSLDCVLIVDTAAIELQGRDEFILLELPETEKGAVRGVIKILRTSDDIPAASFNTLRGTTIILEKHAEPGGRICWKGDFRFIRQDRVWLAAQ